MKTIRITKLAAAPANVRKTAFVQLVVTTSDTGHHMITTRFGAPLTLIRFARQLTR